MSLYRDRYGDVETAGAQLLAISTDRASTQAKFKASLGAQYPFVADEDGRIVKLMDVKTLLFTTAKRVTYVVGQDGRIQYVQKGLGAISPKGAIGSCKLSFTK